MVEDLSKKALALAEQWIENSQKLESKEERAFQDMVQTMLDNENDKHLLVSLIDQSFRSSNPARVAQQITYLLQKYGIATFFSDKEKLLVRLFLLFGKHLPYLAVPQIIQKIRQDTKEVVIHGEETSLKKYLAQRKVEGVRANINFIGESLLGEDEAADRMKLYTNALKESDIDYISIKISTIYSQISSLAFDQTVSVLSERLSSLYHTASQHKVHLENGKKVAKFVNLDMEEYRDLELTIKTFQHTLDKPEFKKHYAGIVLQGYLPDTMDWLEELTSWAKTRVKDGGSPIKVRLVKGANMEMEKIEASQKGWPQAPYLTKIETDSNYKRLLEFALQKENAEAVHIGIGSHNLFDLAYAQCIIDACGSHDYVTYEMLEGMASGARKNLTKEGKKILLYAPVADSNQFINAVAYLVRRLDENTAPDNYLRHSFNLTPRSEQWNFLKSLFLESLEKMDDAGLEPHRQQNRLREVIPFKKSTYYAQNFSNEPDTDWTIPENREWAQEIINKWKKSEFDTAIQVPAVINGEEFTSDENPLIVYDKSQYQQRIVIAQIHLAEEKLIKNALECAERDPSNWSKTSLDERHKILSNVARELRKKRGDLIGVAMAEVGKTMSEADVEVSEAIDFVEFYPYAVNYFLKNTSLEFSPKGAGLVISPWNFPIAIPCGGIASALATGNTVILKPSSNSTLTAYELCRSFWSAGVPREALQFLPCSGQLLSKSLSTSKSIDFTILTGGTDTALQLLENCPDIPLSAETGGKNATIVSAISDRDQAIKNIIHSAFGNTGQKCSATSLLVLLDEVYDDPKFKKMLLDAVKSQKVGSVWELDTKIGPLANVPSGELAHALANLDAGEKWEIEPKKNKRNHYLLSPSIRWGVKKGNYCYNNELFGPVLSVMKAKNLKEAIELVNGTGFGLTSGIESLDEREVAIWRDKIEAGNLYINRSTTGAIVNRQPFGGFGKSAFGPGLKAGSINYVLQFMNCKEVELNEPFTSTRTSAKTSTINHLIGSACTDADTLNELKELCASYEKAMDTTFSFEHDPVKLRGEDNILRYLPVPNLCIRIEDNDTQFTALGRILGAYYSKTNPVISVSPIAPPEVAASVKALNSSLCKFKLVEEAQDKLKNNNYERVLISFEDVTKLLIKDLLLQGTHVVIRPPLKEGRIELLHFLKEQTISHAYHRHGNLGERAKDFDD